MTGFHVSFYKKSKRWTDVSLSLTVHGLIAM